LEKKEEEAKIKNKWLLKLIITSFCDAMASQTLTVLSNEPEDTNRPQGEN